MSASHDEGQRKTGKAGRPSKLGRYTGPNRLKRYGMLRLVEASGAKGLSVADVALLVLQVAESVLFQWLNKYPLFSADFRSAYQRGLNRLKATVRSNLVAMAAERTGDGKFTSAAVTGNIFLAKALCGLSDRGAEWHPGFAAISLPGAAEGSGGHGGNGNGTGVRGGRSLTDLGHILAELDRAGVIAGLIAASVDPTDDPIRVPPADDETNGVPTPGSP